MTTPFHDIDKLAGDWFQCEHCGTYVKGTPENTSHRCEKPSLEQWVADFIIPLNTTPVPGTPDYTIGPTRLLLPDGNGGWTDDITPEE